MPSFIDLECRIPTEHPIRKVRKIVDETLEKIGIFFDELYAPDGHPSIPPEILIRASLLQTCLRCVQSARLEPIDYDLMFHWFVGQA